MLPLVVRKYMIAALSGTPDVAEPIAEEERHDSSERDADRAEGVVDQQRPSAAHPRTPVADI